MRIFVEALIVTARSMNGRIRRCRTRRMADKEAASRLTIFCVRIVEAAALTKLAIRSKAANGYDTEFMELCREELTVTTDAIRRDTFGVARAECGLIAGFYRLRELMERRGEVVAFFVAPEKLRQGVGRQLWASLEEDARTLGIKTIEIDADPYAVPFYEAMGAEVVGQVPSGSIPARFLPRMTKRVAT
jgi:GNAT superfamily N-acetyltransferase